MLVVLSGGLLAALSGTGLSAVSQAFAEEDECKDNHPKLQIHPPDHPNPKAFML